MRTNRLWRAVLLVLVLGVALALRWSTLAIPHWDSDEPAFCGLAQSLVMGNGYTCRRVGLDVVATSSIAPGAELCLIRLGHDAREHGAVLDTYAVEHQDVVDDHAFSVRPPLFPFVLAGSVAVLGSNAVLVVARPGGSPLRPSQACALAAESPHWRREQLPVTLPPLLASLAACALAFLVHRGSSLAATLGALAVATAPLEVWCAHRVTADTLTAALVGGACVLLLRDSLWAVALAGLLGGLSVLAKPSGVLLAPAYAVAQAILVWRGEPWRKAMVRASVFAGVLCATGLWWAGLQFFQPGGSFVTALGYGGVGYTKKASEAAWFKFVHGRPFWIVPASTAVLSPLLGIGAVAVFARARSEKESVPLAVVAALFIVMTMAWPARENRYLLPAYVAFASGFAWVVDRLLERATGAAKAALVALVLAVLVPSVWYARRAGVSGAFELTPIGASYTVG